MAAWFGLFAFPVTPALSDDGGSDGGEGGDSGDSGGDDSGGDDSGGDDSGGDDGGGDDGGGSGGSGGGGASGGGRGGEGEGGIGRGGSSRLGHDDHRGAHQAVERGWARSLGELRSEVQDQFGGEIIGVEIQKNLSRVVYRFKVIDRRSRLISVHINARTKKIIRVEGR